MSAILAMPPPKKNIDSKKPLAPKPTIVEETPKPATKPELIDEDRIDFVNVKDLIKDMERQKTAVSPMKHDAPTNGFTHKNDQTDKSEEIDDAENDTKSEEQQLPLSRSESLTNGAPVQAPKPLPRSSISEAGAGEDLGSEAPKPKPRTTTAPVSGYKVQHNGDFCTGVRIAFNVLIYYDFWG